MSLSFITSVIVAALTTIVVNIIIFSKLQNKFQERYIHVSEQGNPQPQFIDKAIQVSEQSHNPQPQFIDKAIQVAEDGSSQPHFIDEEASNGEHGGSLDISIQADHSGAEADGVQLGTLLAPRPSTTSKSQITDHSSSVPSPASSITTLQPQEGKRNEAAPSIKFFQASSSIQISDTNVSIILNGDGRFTKIQRNWICDYIANLSETNSGSQSHVSTQSVRPLTYAKATFGDYQSRKKSDLCFKGTRVALLREMADCVTGSSGSRIYVLSGQAGTGKSTIALTIASRAAALNLFGASFFFSQDEDCNNAEKFFTTIAHQLCAYNQTFAKVIGDALKSRDGPVAVCEHPLRQLDIFILGPIQSIVQSRFRPILIVVDGLDECDEDDRHFVLIGLNRLVQRQPSFRIILTTRPLPLVSYFLDSQNDQKIIRQKSIEHVKLADDDIRYYLNQVLRRNPWCSSEKEIDSLVHIAGGSFVMASIAVQYIFNKTAPDPAARLQKLLSHFKELDHLYPIILRDVVPTDCNDDGIVSHYQSIVGAIILVQPPLPVSTLTYVLDIDVDDMRAVLDKLQLVILLGSDDIPRIWHRSFSDYVTDQARCKDSRLCIDSRMCHTQIASHCFKIMDRHLKYNILDLGRPARFMSNEDGLKEAGITDEILEEKIPPQLHYACVYWANHFENANIGDADLMNGFAKFANEHILHWFEVMSLIGKLESVHRAIIVVARFLKSTSLDWYQLFSDALRFFLKFSEIIKRSALHTYHTTVCFTPSDTLLSRQYNKEAMQYSIESKPKDWGPLSNILNHGDKAEVVKFSANGTLVVSYWLHQGLGQHGKLKVWDIAGTLVSTIPGHQFAVANNFSLIASSNNDNIITCYNLNGPNGGAKHTTTRTLKTLWRIERLALSTSSESSRIAAASRDGHVWIWDSGNGELIQKSKLEGEHHSTQLEFSPDGTRLVYSSQDITKLWDGISGRFIADLRGSQFVISDNGTRIASYDTHKLSLWSSESGALIGDRKISVSRLAISANGSLLARTTPYNTQVTLWNGDESLAQIHVLEPEYRVHLLAFSPDSILAMATNHTIMLYNVMTRSRISSLSFDGHPLSLAFSPDSTRLALGTQAGRMYFWDIQSMGGFIPRVTVLALSRNCSQLACGFQDGTVELWATSPTKRQIASHKAHTLPVRVLEFSPDGGLLASGSKHLPIKLWNSGDGRLHGTFRLDNGVDEVLALALSNSTLVVSTTYKTIMWSLNTQMPISTLWNYMRSSMSIAENNGLIAVACETGVSLLDAANQKTISTFDVPSSIRTITFLHDSRFIAQSNDGDFLSFNLINKHITKGATPEHLTHLPHLSLWHGIPIWNCQDQSYFSGLFSEDKNPIPVLWIPKHLFVTARAQGSSMIALGCEDGSVILLRLPTNNICGLFLSRRLLVLDSDCCRT